MLHRKQIGTGKQCWGSGSISQRYESADPDPDPDPHQNVTDPTSNKNTSSTQVESQPRDIRYSTHTDNLMATHNTRHTCLQHLYLGSSTLHNKYPKWQLLTFCQWSCCTWLSRWGTGRECAVWPSPPVGRRGSGSETGSPPGPPCPPGTPPSAKVGKTRFFLKNPAQLFFFVYIILFIYIYFFLHICSEERVFRVFFQFQEYF